MTIGFGSTGFGVVLDVGAGVSRLFGIYALGAAQNLVWFLVDSAVVAYTLGLGVLFLIVMYGYFFKIYLPSALTSVPLLFQWVKMGWDQ